MKTLAKLALLASFTGFTALNAANFFVGNTSDSDFTTVISLNPLTINGVATNEVAFEAAYGGDYDAANAVWSWSAADTHILQEVIFISNGTLSIEAGSIVRGQPRSTADFNPGALAIARTAKLIAEASSSNPIIFTTASTTGAASGGRYTSGAFWDANPKTAPQSPATAGTWGGVMILGNAPTNSDRIPATAEQQFFGENSSVTVAADDRFGVEGIPSGFALTNGVDRFGGNQPSHNSGIISYVSIRHGGASISANSEINGLTLGGVGNGTTVNHIEIWGNTDDGVEIFGGTVNLNNIAIFASQDDSLDLDTGWTGTAQFVLVVAANGSDKISEWDGSYDGETVSSVVNPLTATKNPVANYSIVNATFIANPQAVGHTPPGSTSAHDGSQGFHIRDQSAARLINSIVVGYRLADHSVRIDNRGTQDFQDSPLRFVQGLAAFVGVTMYDPAAVKTTAGGWLTPGATADEAALVTALNLTSRANVFDKDPGFLNLPTTSGHGALPNNMAINPVPDAAALGNSDSYLAVAEDTFNNYNNSVAYAPYRGAFDFDTSIDLWTTGWTAAHTAKVIVQKGDGTVYTP